MRQNQMRQDQSGTRNELIAARRLNWLLRPNVLFPVENGDPKDGISGYSSSSRSAASSKWISGVGGAQGIVRDDRVFDHLRRVGRDGGEHSSYDVN
jgi:hypothetical protein